MCLIVSVIAAVIGWITLTATTIWYWLVVVPELYIDDSVLPFVVIVTLGALAFLAVLVGGLRRTQGKTDGLAMMIIAAFTLVGIIFSSLTTVGVLLIPGFLLSTLAATLPPTRPWQRQGTA